jgi:hypothetical protein
MDQCQGRFSEFVGLAYHARILCLDSLWSIISSLRDFGP